MAAAAAASAATATWELWSQGDEIMKGDFGAERFLSLSLTSSLSLTLTHTLYVLSLGRA